MYLQLIATVIALIKYLFNMLGNKSGTTASNESTTAKSNLTF